VPSPPDAYTEEALAVIRASFGKSVARSTLIGGLALLAIAAVAGCEAGADAPTLEFHPASSGAHADFNGISISDAFVLGGPSGAAVPAGGSASLFVGLYNTGSSDDTLQSVSAQGHAASVTIKGGSVTIPASGAANLTGPEPSVVLKNLSQPISGGQEIPVTFDFAHAGAITLELPIESQSDYYSTFSPPAPTSSATPKASASATAKPKPSPSPSK
jgi:hypothetical protein